MSDSNAANSVVVVLAVGVLLLVGGGALLLLWGAAAPAAASSGGSSAFKAYRYDNHPDGALATSEVTLSVDGRELVRRASWTNDGTLDEEASGLFSAGTRVRPLSGIEAEDLMRLVALDPALVEARLPGSLLARD